MILLQGIFLGKLASANTAKRIEGLEVNRFEYSLLTF